MKKYLVCSVGVGLEDEDSWAVVEAENEDRAVDIFIGKQIVKSPLFLEYLDSEIYGELVKLNNDNPIDIKEKRYRKLVLDFFEGNEMFYNIFMDIYIENGALYDIDTGILNPRVTEELLVFIHNKLYNFEVDIPMAIDIEAIPVIR